MTRQQNSAADTAQARPTPIACTPWCMIGNGHGDALYAEDQWCGSDEIRVELSQHPILEAERLNEQGKWESSPDYVHVSAMRRHPGAVTTVDVSHAGEAPIAFTVDEARQLLEALERVLTQVEDGQATTQ